MKTNIDRTDYVSSNGIARFFTKDGAWHIAFPAPEIVDGLKTGGFLFTGAAFNAKSEAIEEIERTARLHFRIAP